MSDAVAIAAHCRNCDAPLGAPPAKFCPNCGQDTSPHPPTFGEFVHEFVGHYVALEGKLWKTLVKLLFLPGELTREYLQGRKQRYVLPLRLYLTASFIFFILIKLIGGTSFVNSTVNGEPVKTSEALTQMEKALAAEKASGKLTAQDSKDLNLIAKAAGDARKIVEDSKTGKDGKVAKTHTADELFACSSGSVACTKIKAYMKEKYGDMTIDQALEKVKERVMSFAPYAIFLLLPVYAGMMQFAYRRRKMVYGEHVVFALHLHAFFFFLFLLQGVLPASAKPFFDLMLMLYGLIAMQRVYGGRWWATGLRYVAVSLTYLLLMIMVAFMVLVFAVFL